MPHLGQKVRKLTRLEMFKLMNLVNQHCKLVGEYAVYDDGWSDEKIQQEFLKETSVDYRVENVGIVRIELVGKLKPYAPPTVASIVETHATTVDALKNRVTALEERMARGGASNVSYIVPPNSSLGQTLVARIDDIENRLTAFEDCLERLTDWATSREVNPFPYSLEVILKDWNK